MQTETAIDLYCAAWNEENELQRLSLLRSCMIEGAEYVDPTISLKGLAQISEHIAAVFKRFPSSRIVRTSSVDHHHGIARFSWVKELQTGERLADSIDVVEVASDGKLRRVIGFFGPLMSA